MDQKGFLCVCVCGGGGWGDVGWLMKNWVMHGWFDFCGCYGLGFGPTIGGWW